MPDLLLELRSEEIPARMQRKAAGDLRKMVTDGLVEAGLTYEAAREYWTPRRLTLDIRGVTARSKDVREEIKGPSHQGAAAGDRGFSAQGRPVGRSSEAHVHSDPKKGDFYVAHISRPGRAAEEIIAELVPSVDPRLPLAEVDALGAGFGKARLAALGASAAVDPVHLRSGDRGAHGGRFRGRRHPLRQRHLRPPFPCAGRDHGQALRGLCGQARGGQGRHRCRPPQGDHPLRRPEPRLRQRARSRRGRRSAGGSVGAGRMAGRADRRLRGGLFWPSRPRSSG